MKIVINYTVEITDDFRRAINLYNGKTGIADRDEIRSWFVQYGHSMDDDLMEALPAMRLLNVDVSAQYTNVTVRRFLELVAMGVIGKPDRIDSDDDGESTMWWKVETLEKYINKKGETNG